MNILYAMWNDITWELVFCLLLFGLGLPYWITWLILNWKHFR